MRKITFLMTLLLTMVTTTFAQDYEPRETGSKGRSDRNVTAVKLTGETYGEQAYTLTAAEQFQNWADVSESVVFQVAPGEEVTPVVAGNGSWVHYSVFVDFDGDGFTSGIEDGSEWKPAGDLVSYSFYNNGGSSDEYGWNSVGQSISGDNRNKPALPAFTAPAEPGKYRMRFVQGWCNIDPAGDADGKFGDFINNGDQVIDVTLEVVAAQVAEPIELVSIDPAEGVVSKVHVFTLTFNQEVKMNEGDEYGAMVLYNGMPACGALVEVNEADAKVVTITMDMEANFVGQYMLYLSEGCFVSMDGTQMTPEMLFTYEVEAPKPIANVSELKNEQLYTVVQKSHSKGITGWAVAPGSSVLKSTFDIMLEDSQVGVTTDPTQQFAFLTVDGGATNYLYHAAEKKFVNKEGVLEAAPVDPVYFEPGQSEGTFVVKFDDQHYINVGGSRQMIIDTWSYADGGNSCTITPAAEFDPTEALAAFAPAASKTTVEMDPVPGKVDALPTSIQMVFSKNIKEVKSMMIRSNNTGFRGVILEESDYIFFDNMMFIGINPEYVAYCPHLTLVAEIIDEDGNAIGYGDVEEAINVTWFADVPANIFQLQNITPAANSDVPSLSTFEIELSHPTGQSYIAGIDPSKQIVLKNEAGEVVANGTVELNEETFFAPAKIVLDKTINAVGLYTLHIPEGTFYNESFNPDMEDFGVAEYGAIYNPELNLTYQVVIANRYLYHPAYNGLLQMAEDGSESYLVDATEVADFSALAWQFVPALYNGVAYDDQYTIYNVAAQRYLGACQTSQPVQGVTEDAAKVYVWQQDGVYDVFLDREAGGTHNYLHVAGHNVMVGWEAGSAASHWFVLNSADELQTVLNNRGLEAAMNAAVAKAEKAKEISQSYYKPLITDAAQFASNNQDPEEGSFAALLDGDNTTFFHSNWHGGGPEPHDLQVVLPNNDLTAFLVKYESRNSSGYRNDRPVKMSLYGGTLNEDGTVTYETEAFANLTTEDGIGAEAGEFKFSTGEKVYDAIKFEVHETVMTDGSKGKVFFTYGEFQMYSQEMTPGELELTEDEVAALDAAVEAAKNAHLVKDNYAEIIEALNEAIIDAYNYDRETIDLVAQAKEVLNVVGVGYPVVGGEARATLEAVIAQVEAEPTTDAALTLAMALEAYYGATEVALPEAGKYYTFTMVAKNGNQFYLNYTGEDVAMVPYYGEELPESAKFLASMNADSTAYNFQTIDGNYLVYHTKYAGVNWLQGGGNTTGFQAEADDMANITLAKMVAGNNVAADNNEEIFGLMTWYGKRGYDTGKNEDAYGFMVLKTDGSDYDGASAPFWNANYSSAFRLAEVAGPEGPALTANPAPGKYDALPTQVVIEFAKEVKSIDFAMLRTTKNTRGEMLEDYTIEGNKVTVNIPETSLAGCAYAAVVLEVVDIDGNYVTYGDMDGYVYLEYETEPVANLFECTKITPAEGEVTELESFILEFNYEASAWGFSAVGGFDPSKEIVLKNEAGDVVAKASIDYTDPEYYTPEATITLDKKVTEAGVYTLVVPEGTVYNEGYYPVEADFGVSMGAVYNPELSFTYTVVGGGSVVEEYPINFDKDQDATRTDRVLSAVALNDQMIAVANTAKAYNDMTASEVKFVCAPGEEVVPVFDYSGLWMHGYVYVDFGNDGAFSFDASQNDQTGLDLVSYSFYGAGSENEGYNSIGDFISGDGRNTITCPAFKAPEAPGVYRIRFKVDWNNVDAGGCVDPNNHILNNGGYIVDATLEVAVGDGISGVTVDGAKDVYTLDGRKVAVKAGQKLNKGIYIVNGKKVYVK